MSRQIDLSGPLSTEDKKYLADRGRHAEIAFAESKGEQRELTPEEIVEMQRRLDVEAMGRRTPVQMESVEDDADGDDDDDDDGDETQIDSAEYDPDDVTFVMACEYSELQAHLKQRELSAQGDKDTLRTRLLDALKAETEKAQQGS